MRSGWFIACALLISARIEATNYVPWSTDFSGVLYHQDLASNVVQESSKTWMVTQCAEKCLRTAECQSFAYQSKGNVCKLANTAVGALTSADTQVKVNSSIYPKTAFKIQLSSLGACSGVTCKNGGLCILQRHSPDGFICFCKSGFSGKFCQTPTEKPAWSEWSKWSPCSSTCDNGYQYSSRSCVFTSNGSVVERSHCDGPDSRVQKCFLSRCPSWNQWSQWSVCSTHFTCGRGVMTRNRVCHKGKPNVDTGCIGMAQEDKPCNSPSCSVNQAPLRLTNSQTVGKGFVEIYDNIRMRWGQVCGDGFDDRAGELVCKSLHFRKLHQVVKTSSLTAPKSPFALKNLRCTATSKTLQECRHDGWNSTISCSRGAEVECIVDGGWGPWNDWSKCSVTCGRGVNIRERACTHPKQSFGLPCPGKPRETKNCVTDPCPVDGKWTPWTKWSSCNVSCGGGISNRERTCDEPKHGGKPCIGSSFETKVCNDFHCKVDGVWTPFTPWTTCNVTCGGGLQQRSRTCIGPFYNGKDCVGDKVETRACNTRECPVDGYWQPWDAWSRCNVSCGGGRKYRTRTCVQPKYGGKNCTGISKTVQECNQHPCPVDGKWKAWSNWTACTKSCGNGTRSRNRECFGPFHGGKSCQGANNEIESCNPHPCPVDGIWGAWSKWSDCTKSCGNGTTTRTRPCTGPFHGGKDCVGPRSETKSCKPEPCPIDGRWHDWAPWSACSTTCSNGLETRKRTCNPPKYGGKDCIGKAVEEQKCNLGPCPLPGKWSDWSAWTKCSVSCRQGERTRKRTCLKVVQSAPLKGCNGTEQEQEFCNDFDCKPVLQSCSAWKRLGMIGNFNVQIDPTGKENYIVVKCNLDDPEGETIVHHDFETERDVPKFENPGMNVMTPNYGVNWNSITSLVDKSKTCKQYLQLKCQGASMHRMMPPTIKGPVEMMSWWTNRYGDKMTYWGGSNPQHGNCACSLNNDCVWKNLTCNCDANDNVWRSDEGYLTYRPHLPVKTLIIGDTGGQDENAKVKLGPLVCKG